MDKEELNNLVKEAFEHLHKGRARIALTTAKKAYEKEPENVDVISCFAWALLENSYLNQALELMNYAVQLESGSQTAHLYRGYLLMRMGIFEGALSDLVFVTTKKNDHGAWIHLIKARAFAGLERYYEGLEQIEKALKHNEKTEENLQFTKDLFKIVLDVDHKRFLFKKSLIEEAADAFREKEYWFSLWASREIMKSGSSKNYTEAQLLELETMIALFQYRPAILKAEQIKNNFLGVEKFHSLYQRLEILNRPESQHISLDNIVIPEKKRTDFLKYPNKIFDVLHARTYDLIENMRSGKRTYLLQFSEERIRFIGVEVVIDNPFYKNKKAVVDGIAVWCLNNREVGRHQFELPIEKEWASVEFVQSWGAESSGFWKKGQGQVDIYLGGSKVCSRWFFVDDSEIVNFESADANQEKFENQEIQEIEQPTNITEISSMPREEKSLDELLSELDNYIGLNTVKQSMRDFVDYLKFLNERKESGFKTEENVSVHCVFLGNPGTGKTTVARLLGKIFKAMGLLKNGHVIEVDRTGLVGQYVGETAQKADKVITESIGGLLFIDEAYTIKKPSMSNDFGQEAIDVLLKRMEDKPGEFVVIAAGYPEEMNSFIESNPGLKSRFTHTFNFEDYTPDELLEIFKLVSSKEEYNIDDAAASELIKEFIRLYRKRDKSFGNARLVRNIFNEAKMQLSKRYIKMPAEEKTKEAMTTILKEDIAAVLQSSASKEFNAGIDEDNLKKCLEKLNGLTGLTSVKKEINELVKVARYFIEQGENPQNKLSSHLVFLGNPGTGKTTVARLFSEIYSALGILPRGHLIEADRQAMVASYVGQTATKTKEIIDKAIGGTLFIDEAYTLVKKDAESDFGREAIDTLLKRMEDDRGKFIVIAAGYTDNMKTFLESNPGLESRFTKKIIFEDYTPDELMVIAETYFKEKGHQLDEEVISPLRKYFVTVFRKRDKNFGNARLVRNLVDAAVKNHMLRLADFPPEERHEESVKLISMDDIAEVLSIPGKSKENHKNSGDPVLLTQYLDELNSLTGLHSVKTSINKLVSGIKVAKLRQERGFKVIPKNLNCVFAGNTGTGKTTVAKLMGKIYKELGVLENGHLVEVDRTQLVSVYPGDSAVKTEEIIQRAIGGILFIDEAYSLMRTGNESGKEALEILLKKLDEYSGKFVCVLSGYENEIKQFLESNPALQSRFVNFFLFEDFSPRQMLEIAFNISDRNGYVFDEGAWQLLLELFNLLYNKRTGSFGNARTVRNLFYKAVSNQEERILNVINPDDDVLCTITLEDIEKINLSEL